MANNDGGKRRREGYDLGERLLRYAAGIVRLVEQLVDTRAGRHVGGQLLRSGTAALPNHAEARSAESAADFIHKLKVGLKELRESERWLLLIRSVPLVEPPQVVDPLLRETDELIRILVASVRTAEQNAARGVHGPPEDAGEN